MKTTELQQPINTGIAAINDAVQNKEESTQIIGAKCRALLRGYAIHWKDSQYIPIEVEVVASADIVNPATGYNSRILKTAGKLDVLATRPSMMSGSHKLTLIDHKTTSDEIADPDGTYWQQLAVESQPTHYMLLQWLNGIKLDEAMWDVLRKPSIAPRKLKSKAEHALVVANQIYFNQRLSTETMNWLQVSDRENLELYEARLFHDCTEERPEWYFQRRTIPRLDSELITYATDLWDSGQLVLEARRKDRWPKHSGSCMNYGSPCRFLGICSGQDQPTSANWEKRESVHEELSPDMDRNTLTYSSIRTFQTCPKKFYYHYHLGIKRIVEADREALLFGHIWHLGLEAYWKSLQPKESNNGSGNSIENSGNRHECQEAYAF